MEKIRFFFSSNSSHNLLEMLWHVHVQKGTQVMSFALTFFFAIIEESISPDTHVHFA